MKIGKFEVCSFNRMYWDGMQLQPPWTIIYRTALFPVYYVVLVVLCLLRAAILLDMEEGKRLYRDNLLF